MGRSRSQSCCYLAHLGHISSSELLLFGPPWAHHFVLRVAVIWHLGHMLSSELLLFDPPWAYLVLKVVVIWPTLGTSRPQRQVLYSASKGVNSSVP